ncbi:MAG: LL-diaminopimelate aminotransferase [Oscillospiraceae bacterium]|nr:LL-diaminopimelate aminotransferase [Oscillospiraceae bacterium]
MIGINPYFARLRGGYLFAEIAKRTEEYRRLNPDKELIRLGIGDVTQPLVPEVIRAMHGAVDEMSREDTFRGYGPYYGYDFLVRAIIENDYAKRGVTVGEDEVFVNDGCKSDSSGILDLFSEETSIAVCDPVYPVYVDAAVMSGRGGVFDEKTEAFSRIDTLRCDAANGFLPIVPDADAPDAFRGLIFLCFPNNPTGKAIGRDDLKAWVEYANRTDSVILYDSAYEAYISEDLPHSIFEIEGARTCAIELRSFSKTAGFTGVRCGYTVIPTELKRDGTKIRDLWARRQATHFNGVSYITQRAAEAVYSKVGKRQNEGVVRYYLENARVLRQGLSECGFKVNGGVNAPYLWVETPEKKASWAFFDELLEKHAIVVTPGSGFGAAGEGYFRITAFGSWENASKAILRLKAGDYAGNGRRG